MRLAIGVGLRFGVALALLAIVLGWLGTAPEFHWIPEVPLLLVTAVVPIALCGAAGWRTAIGTRGLRAASAAGATTGALGGLTGGLFFAVSAGKPAVNIPVLLVFGLFGGALVGLASGYFAAGR